VRPVQPRESASECGGQGRVISCERWVIFLCEVVVVERTSKFVCHQPALTLQNTRRWCVLCVCERRAANVPWEATAHKDENDIVTDATPHVRESSLSTPRPHTNGDVCMCVCWPHMRSVLDWLAWRREGFAPSEMRVRSQSLWRAARATEGYRRRNGSTARRISARHRAADELTWVAV
jgi:hypothetical protein